VAVQTALAKVPEEFRVAVVLCDLYRVPYADAAQILEIPVGTVKSRVFRGRLALAECLGAPPDRPPLHVPGTPGTDTTSPASEPTDPPSRPQE
jgi:RNA polymerase sigma-70 factor (ECF subfamily)